MSRKNGYGHGDVEYLRAAITQKEHTENEHDVVVVATIGVCRSPYVLSVRLEAWTKGEEAAQASLCSYETTWPNASTTGWCATLFQAYVKLDRLVEDSMRDYAREWTFRQR